MSEQPSWIGVRPNTGQIFALMSCGVTGLMVAGLQPLLLGALAQEGRVGASQLGVVATAELFSMGLTAGLCGGLLKSTRLKLIAIVALLALAAADALTPFAHADMLTLLRAAAGVPSGVLVWVTISLIARTPTPERWAGGFLTAQTLGQFLMAAVLAAFVVTRFGSDGGFIALAALCLANVGAALLLPSALEPLPQAATAGLPGPRGWIALSVSFLFLAASSGVWVYAERLSSQAHHAAIIAGQAVSISLACQIAGGSAATLLGGRISWFWALLACVGVDLAVFATFATLPGPSTFLLLAGAFGFVWMFATAFLVPLTIEADPTRRAALLIGGAQLVGGSLGPLFASFFVTDADVRGVLVFSGASVIGALAIILTLHATRGRTAP